MGTYTTNLKFYKPASTEFIDVDAQLNRNWAIADKSVKRLVEYEFSSLQNPDTSNDPSKRSRFYKQYSNSFMTFFSDGPLWWQDPSAFVATWVPGLSWFNEGYNFSPTGFNVVARLQKKTSGTTAEVEWSGGFYELGGTMELNTNVVAVNAGSIPSQFCPVVNKYFDVWAGNTSSDFSIARVLIGSDGRLEFKRYGANPSAGTSDENRVELTGIKYNVEVVGT